MHPENRDSNDRISLQSDVENIDEETDLVPGLDVTRQTQVGFQIDTFLLIFTANQNLVAQFSTKLKVRTIKKFDASKML